MIVRFSDIQFDAYGRLESPTLFLKTLAGQSKRPITNYFNLHTNFQYNDVSTITFDITDYYENDGDMLLNPAYEDICGLRIVDMEPFGEFILMEPKVSDDGIKKIKSCTAYSLEYELNFKTMPALEESQGGYVFYDTTGNINKYSLMDIVMEKIPNWTLGHVDTAICTRVREFSTSSENLYSFLMNSVQESYNCLFIFDTKNRIINVYDAADDVRIENLPIYISKENLINEIQLDELTEDIVTCLSVYGADDLSISSVNPLGGDKLYNIDYFIEIGDVPSSIAEKWKLWKSDMEHYQKLFAATYSEVYSEQLALNTQKIKLQDLQGQLDTEEIVLSTYQGDQDANADYSSAIEESKTKIASITKDINAQEKIVEELQNYLDIAINSQNIIKSICSHKNYFEDYELNILNQFFKEGSIQDTTFVATNIASKPDSYKEIISSDGFKVKITDGNLYRADEYVNLTDEEKANISLSDDDKQLIQNIENEITTFLNKNFFTIDIGSIVISNSNAYDKNGQVLSEFTDDSFYLRGTVINSTVSYDNAPLDNGNYSAVVTLTISSPTYNGDEYKTATFVMIGEIDNFTYHNAKEDKNDTMSFSMIQGILTLTCQNTMALKQETVQQLYDYGKVCSSKLAYPSYEFSINSSNFIFSKQFEEFKNRIELGKSINVEFNEDLFKRPILIGVELNYEDLTDFNLTFSNKFRLNSPEFLLSDVIGKNATTISNLDASKFSYAAYSNSNIRNEVTELMESALDVSKRQIINAKNQNFLIDDAGIHLRKLMNPVTNTFSPNEIRLINNKIAFTSDGWKSVNLAIGEMKVGNDTFMGVVADSLIGKALIGNQLTIEANKIDENGQPGIMTFRVDGQGAYLGNGSLYMEHATGNKIALDPNYGLIAGNADLFTIGPTGAQMKAINADGTYEHDGKFEVLPKDAYFWLDSKRNNAYFRGDIYADNGYFAGDVSANTGVLASDGSLLTTIGAINEDAKKALENIDSLSKEAAEDIQVAMQAAVNAESNAKEYADQKDVAQTTNLTTAYQEYTNSKAAEINTNINKYLMGGGTTSIGSDYVISPLIGGGYLDIEGGNSRVIIDPNNLTKSNYIFQVQSAGETTVGIDHSGNAEFSGTVKANAGYIAGWQINGDSTTGAYYIYTKRPEGYTSLRTSGNICLSTNAKHPGDSEGASMKIGHNGSAWFGRRSDGLFAFKVVVPGDTEDDSNSSEETITATSIVMRGPVYTSKALFNSRLCLGNGYVLRGMKKDMTDSTNDSNSLRMAHVNADNNVILGGADNTGADTEIRAGRHVYLKCNGTTSGDDANEYAIKFWKSGDSAWFRPCVDGKTNLGGTNYAWKNVYTKNLNVTNPPWESSDIRLKENVHPILDSKYMMFFDNLIPIFFNMKDTNTYTDKVRLGFSAQGVKLALEKSNLTDKDFIGLHKDGEYYSLGYEQFIALNTAKIKQVEKRLENALKIIEKLRTEIAQLKS